MAVDPLVGETWAAVRAVELAGQHGWDKVIFETDSLLLFEDVTLVDRSPCWKIADLIPLLRAAFGLHPDWSLSWISRKLNNQAHLLAQWAARAHVSGTFNSSSIPLHILLCDSNILP
ncbi:hypothetical protein CJ030_MR1G028648 [Morella rubra]|uniref:RNase H type-1 domain-containing protein n=1 Tax=Morella rubra TaxID=262757 RepID=A0A6A1WM34_9ROSI|nr:hypothetical protein CJ030_MR1G028648 [Morella rubra]